MMGTQITQEVDRVLYTRAGIEMGVAATKTFTSQVTLLYLLALQLAQVRRTLPEEEIAARSREVAALPREDRRLPGRRPSDRGDRAAPLPEAVLPLPRAPHRAAGLPRGRAQAQGDLVHPDRGLLGRRDEARSDRAPRRARRRSCASRPTPTSTTRSSPTSRRCAPAGRRSSRSRPTATRTSSTTRTTSSTCRARTRSCRRPSRSFRCSLLAYRIARLRGLNIDQPRNLAKTVTVE